MDDCVNCATPIDEKEKVKCTTCNASMHKACVMKCDCGNELCDTCMLEDGKCKNCLSNDSITLEHIRRSHIELYKRCPHAFYLEVVKGVERDVGIYAQLGIDLHDLFEKYSYEGNMQQFLEEFEQIWEAYDDSMFKDEAFKKKIYDRAITSIGGFFNILPRLTKPPFATEEQIIFEIDENMPKVSITMDRIDEVNGELVLSDWKTGKVMVGKKLATDLQAPLYIHAVRQYYNKPVSKFVFYYVSENKEREFVRVDDDKYVCMVGNREYFISIQESLREVKQIFGRIKAKRFSIDPNQKAYNCTICPYKDTHCEGVEVQSWRQVNQSRGYV